MALSEEALKAGEEARARLAAMSAEENRRSAMFVRTMAVNLESERHRARTEEMARYFEERAEELEAASPPPTQA